MTVDQAGHDEIILFTEKPNALLYALEVTRHNLLFWSIAGAAPLVVTLIYTEGSLLSAGNLTLVTYGVIGVFLLIVAFGTARCLTFVVTSKRAIVRVSLWRATIDGLSIAIDTVKRIEINSYSATYGNVYLIADRTAASETFKTSQPELTESTAVVKRTASLLGSIRNWPRLLGFYGFKGADQFTNIIIEQQKRRSEFKRGR